MAFISQEKKKKIAAALKAADLPEDLKYSLRIDNHSGLVVTIRQAPATVLDDCVGTTDMSYVQVNIHHIENQFAGETREWLEKIVRVIKDAGEWYDKSDSMTDYFNIAFYIDINFGAWNKECVYVGDRKTDKVIPHTTGTLTDEFIADFTTEVNTVSNAADVTTLYPRPLVSEEDRAVAEDLARSYMKAVHPDNELEPQIDAYEGALAAMVALMREAAVGFSPLEWGTDPEKWDQSVDMIARGKVIRRRIIAATAGNLFLEESK